MKKAKSSAGFRKTRLAVLLGAGLMAVGGAAQAFTIETNNPDVQTRLDTTVRYNAGWRMKDRNPGIANNAANDEAEYLFNKGDMVLNRVDIFSEFDYTYQRNMGFRISGALWYDDAYGDKSKGSPATIAGNSGAYPNQRFTDYVKRFYNGPSGEFLDAFVWKNFSLFGDENNLNVKVGRFATLWGVPNFGTAAANSVSVDMAPSDGAKQSLSPGATAKETTLPIAQTIASLKLNPNWSVSAQVTHEWRSSRLPEGGTYFGVSDAILYGPPRSSPAVGRLDPKQGKNGDLSLMALYSPDWLQGTYIGFYARKFSQKTPTWPANISCGNPFQSIVCNPAAGSTNNMLTAYFENDVKLWGVSVDTALNVGFQTASNIGFEISHRTNQPLNANPGINTLPTGFEGPKGDTWHALANITQTFNQNTLWDTASLVGELVYQKLDKVTTNASLYKSANYVPVATAPALAATCSGDRIIKGCSTDDAWHLSLLFGPTWQQILPSWDLNGTLLYQIGLKGNAPTGGINEGAGLYQIAGEMVYQSKHSFKLAYTDYFGKAKYLTPTATTQTINGTTGNYGDRDLIQFTYNYAF